VLSLRRVSFDKGQIEVVKAALKQGASREEIKKARRVLAESNKFIRAESARLAIVRSMVSLHRKHKALKKRDD